MQTITDLVKSLKSGALDQAGLTRRPPGGDTALSCGRPGS